MGLGGISIWQLLIVLVIILLLFGTKRLKNVGSDLGEAIKGFRHSMSKTDGEGDASDPRDSPDQNAARRADHPGAAEQTPRDSERNRA